MARRVWWSKTAYVIVARKQREWPGSVQGRSRPKGMLPMTHFLLKFSATLKIVLPTGHLGFNT
jgi:hypothetical protein